MMPLESNLKMTLIVGTKKGDVGGRTFDPFTPHTHKLAAASPFYPFFFHPFDDTHKSLFRFCLEQRGWNGMWWWERQKNVRR
jgi:hypothetical protein